MDLKVASIEHNLLFSFLTVILLRALMPEFARLYRAIIYGAAKSTKAHLN